MVYEFKEEDFQFHKIIDELGIVPFFKCFFLRNEVRLRRSYNELINQMKEKEKNEQCTRFIENMDYEEFADMVEFTFEVIFAKDFMRLFGVRDSRILSLSAHSLAEKMSKNPDNPEYTAQLERVLGNCCKSVMEGYLKLC